MKLTIKRILKGITMILFVFLLAANFKVGTDNIESGSIINTAKASDIVLCMPKFTKCVETSEGDVVIGDKSSIPTPIVLEN